jgi:predicted  nucleic acid-binding Zn-ribbon protein
MISMGMNGERLRYRLHNTQKDLKEAEEELEALKKEIVQTTI